MLRLAKTFSLMAVVATLACQTSFSFSLLGPYEDWQDPGGQGPNPLDYGFPGLDNGGPHNLGEEFRWNIPIVYYTYDQAFLDYFGSNGVFAVDQAFVILNALTNVSSYSADLGEFPLEASRVNFKAQALQLIDLKSTTLHMMIEQLGLAQPDRYTWTLHDRWLPPGAACPAYVYSVVQRNFDPVTWEPSSYVNGTLYSYSILELCPTPSRADAVEFLVDPLSNPFSSVASLGLWFSFSDFSEADLGVSRFGFFYTGLTRDDVGGLRYLWRTNNMNWENVTPDTVQFVTNNEPQLIVTSNLTLLAAQALTNTAAGLSNLYPNLVITSTSNSFAVVATTNITPFFTNDPWVPAGFFRLAFATNVTFSVQTLFHHTFGNVATIQFINGQWVVVPVSDIRPVTNRTFVTIQTAVVTNAPWSPAGIPLLITNFSTRTFLSNQVSGEFLILPTNLCDVRIIQPILTNVVAITNSIVATNDLGLTNVFGQFFAQNLIGFSTNHAFLVFGVNCNPSATNLMQGIEQMTFIRRDFDSLLGRFWNPITNIFSHVIITNDRAVRQFFRREVVRPDILFSASDQNSGPSGPLAVPFLTRSIFYNENHVLTNYGVGGEFLAGPGTIEPPVFISFNKAGPTLINFGPQFIDEATSSLAYRWGSFDAGTNEPVVYPQGSSIMDLENQVLLRVTTTSLTNTTEGIAFSEQIQGVGGQPPYTFTLSSGSLPPGVNLSSTGVVSGTPQQQGDYTFIVRMTEQGGRAVLGQVTVVVLGP